MPFIGRDGTTAFLPATVNTSSSLTISNEGDLVVDTSDLFVDSSANKVGIGTQTPALRAHIYSTENADAALIESTQNFATLRFKSATNTSGPTIGIDGSGGLQLDQKDTSKYIAFAIGTEKLRIASSGQIGIGGANYGTAGQVLTSGGASGAVSWTTVSVSGFLSNIVEDTSPQLGGDLQSNGNDIDFADGDKAIFGAGSDLQIYHDATDSWIDNDEGDLYIRNTGDDIILRANDDVVIQVQGSEAALLAKGDGAVELYHNGQKRFETEANGAKVTGILDVTSDFKVGAATNILLGGTALPSVTGLLGGSLSGTLGEVTMAYLAAAPSSPVQGQFYFNSLSSKAQIYTGSAFVDLVPSGGGGGGGGGGSSTDAQATLRKYTYSVSSTTSSISGAADGITDAGSFITGRKYQIKTVGNTDFTAIGSANNNVGTIFTATGAGSGTGDAYDVLVYVTNGSQNVEVYVNGAKAVEGATNDYVAASGTSVNFVVNLTSGDVVDILVYELLTNDAFVLASGGTFTGNVGINTTSIQNRLHIHSNANEQGILLTQAGNNYSVIYSDANRTGATSHLLAIEGHWNGTPVAEIALQTGSDLTNKDDGQIIFRTSSANNLTNSDRMCIASNGKIGINNNTPLYPLHFKTAMASTPSYIHMEVTGTNTLGGGGGIAFDTSASNAVSNNSLFLATVSGERNSNNDGSNDLVFRTSKANVTGDDGVASTPKEKLRITSDGRVNIGQASDVDHTLCVAGTDNTTSLTGGHSQGIQLQNKSTTDGTYSQIEWRTASGGRYARIAGIQDDANGNGGQLVFLTETSSGTTTEKLRITSTGKIGVNNTSPSVSVDLSENTDAVALPTGTTAQRPSGTDAYIRKNSTNNALEFYNGTNWVEIITDYFPTGSTTLG